jgi:putative transposase
MLSQFTSAAFTGVLECAGIQISMDGRGRWMDNVFIERLWRSLRELHEGLSDWIAFYNDRRLHQALGYRAPMTVWRHGISGAVDVMDNTEEVLPTCPQRQHQKQTTALAA